MNRDTVPQLRWVSKVRVEFGKGRVAGVYKEQRLIS